MIRIRRIFIFILMLSFALFFAPRLPVSAHAEERVVRVGWYESPFNLTDDEGRLSGYGYEYQQKIAAYTGWKYEYVTGGFSELLDRLMIGEIDLLSDVSYTEERAEKIFYSSLPMGAEEYYIFISPDNTSIKSEDLSTFNGKRVGVNKDTVQETFFKEWAHLNGIEATVVELEGTEEIHINKLRHGEIDAYITLDGFGGVGEMTPVCKVGSSDFYFGVSNKQPELLNELNAAMNRIYEENHYYNQELYFKYLKTSGTNRYLNTEEKDWLNARNGVIRVGYQDNYLAFCAKDPATGELTGALKDYLDYASTCLENAEFTFEMVCYPTAAAAMQAVKAGEIDCMFPANLTMYDGETQGFIMTSPIMRTDISAIVLESEQKGFFKKEHITVAVNKGNTNYQLFLKDNFPTWIPVTFNDTPEGLRAISEGKVDCLLMSNYRVNNIASLCKKYKLVSLSTGVEIDYSFAVKHGNSVLYSILNKVDGVVPEPMINAALSYYFTEDAKEGIGDLISQNMGYIMIVLAIIAVIILALIFVNYRAEKRAKARQQLIVATEFDTLTGLYNKSYFMEYAHRLKKENPDTVFDAVAMDIESFHSVNAINGTEFGDKVLSELGHELHAFALERGCIACRTVADHFFVYCAHSDDWHPLFDRVQARLDTLSATTNIRLRMGVMPGQSDMEPRVQFEHALTARNLAREFYRGHLVVFDDKMRRKEEYERKLLNDLRQAIDEKEFEVYYQPKYDISAEPAKFIGMEALVRWRHHEFGMISPADFIPLFERNGQIGEVDKFVWTEAISQVARWKEKYGKVIPVSINLSRVDMVDSTLGKTIDNLVKRNGLDPDAIRLEVTESAYFDNNNRFIEVIDGLRSRGYKIDMDDFGTGYSSLGMLSSMPIDTLKMDQSFVRKIDQDEKDVQMVELILGIAKNLRIPVIAEGVETEIQLQMLKNLGCEMVQGYYFSRPLPAAEFEKQILNG